MVDNRSAGFYGIGGAFNFKSGDPSGTAAKTSDEKYGPGTEYGIIGRGEDEDGLFQQEPYTDRSAQLRATLNSLAMMNVAAVLNSKRQKKSAPLNFKELEDETELIIEENLNRQHHENNSDEDEFFEEEEDINLDMFEDEDSEEAEIDF